MTTLAEFLLARIAEDEEQGEKLYAEARRVQEVLRDPAWLGRPIPGWSYWPEVEAMADAFLADCETKRGFVEKLRFVLAGPGDPYEDGVALDVLQDLALPYADHEDWREEWRP